MSGKIAVNHAQEINIASDRAFSSYYTHNIFFFISVISSCFFFFGINVVCVREREGGRTSEREIESEREGKEIKSFEYEKQKGAYYRNIQEAYKKKTCSHKFSLSQLSSHLFAFFFFSLLSRSLSAHFLLLSINFFAHLSGMFTINVPTLSVDDAIEGIFEIFTTFIQRGVFSPSSSFFSSHSLSKIATCFKCVM